MSADRLEISAVGTPRAQGSKRHVGHGRMVEMSVHLPAWRRTLIRATADALLGSPTWGNDRPFRLAALFMFTRGKTVKRASMTVAPDLDKLVRAAGDALKIGGAIRDDSLIVSVLAEKIYAGPGENPGARLTLTALD